MITFHRLLLSSLVLSLALVRGSSFRFSKLAVVCLSLLLWLLPLVRLSVTKASKITEAYAAEAPD